MRRLSTEQAIALHRQPTLTIETVEQICQLSAVEKISSEIQSWSFEQFFGFTFHLFITTEDRQIRQRTAGLLPNFGSIVVLSCLKTIQYFGQAHPVTHLSKEILAVMSPEALVIGLIDIFTERNDATLQSVAIERLLYRIDEQGEPMMRWLRFYLPNAQYSQVEEGIAIAHSRQQLSRQHAQQDKYDRESAPEPAVA